MKEIKRIKKEELEEIKKFFKRKKNLKIRIKKIFFSYLLYCLEVHNLNKLKLQNN